MCLSSANGTTHPPNDPDINCPTQELAIKDGVQLSIQKSKLFLAGPLIRTYRRWTHNILKWNSVHRNPDSASFRQSDSLIHPARYTGIEVSDPYAVLSNYPEANGRSQELGPDNHDIMWACLKCL